MIELVDRVSGLNHNIDTWTSLCLQTASMSYTVHAYILAIKTGGDPIATLILKAFNLYINVHVQYMYT